MQRSFKCHICNSSLFLQRTGGHDYTWQCPKNCIPKIDTGVSISELLDDLRPDESGTIEFNASRFFPPLSKSRVATAKVYMAQILYHFIECSWGGCYNSLYFNILVPYLDAPDILDYVLRSSVIQDGIGVQTGRNGAKIYSDLRGRLEGVKSPHIRNYLAENFPQS